MVMFGVSLSMNGAVLADSKPTPPTVETTLGADGSAVSTRVLNRNGADTSGISASSALKTSIAYSLNGQPANRDQLKGARGPVTVTYKVENTTGKTQDVTYTSADGQPHTQQLLIQVPFVAIVEATVPGSYNNVQAPGGAVSAGTDGNLHIIWSLVLFSPIGSPTQEVSFSAQADAPQGLPGVTVTARSINPSATEGLSSGTLTANAAVAQNDLFGTYATGADQGLAQLGSGIGQLVDGLTLLRDGSQQLSAGLATAAAGSQQLADGLHSANSGGHQLADGFASPTGAPDLTSGSKALAAGLAQIDAGLAALADPATGLPNAKAGSVALGAGVGAMLVGLGDSAVPGNTILYGLAGLNAGLAPALAGIGPGPSYSQAITGVTYVTTTITATVASTAGLAVGQPITVAGITGFATNNPNDPNGGFVVASIVDATHLTYVVPLAPTGAYGSGGTVVATSEIDGLLALQGGISAIANHGNGVGGPLTETCAGIAIPGADCAAKLTFLAGSIGTSNTSPPFPWTLIGGLNKLSFGLSHTATGPTDPGGAMQVITSIAFGLDHPVGSLGGTDPGGIKQGLGAVQLGLTSLTSGLTTAVGGVTQLHAGSTTAAAGANTLKDGISTAGAGAAKLAAGLDLLAAGANQLNAGVPTAVTGSNKITTGLGSALSGAQQAGQGTSAISAQGTAPLITQLQDASNNAHLELATIDATGARAGSAPLGADATWLYRLDAVGPSGGNNLVRNVAFGVGGLLLLLLVGAGGFMFGRRGRVTA
jgi:putative membrane protein